MKLKFWTVVYHRKETGERISSGLYAATSHDAAERARAEGEPYGWLVESVTHNKLIKELDLSKEES